MKKILSILLLILSVTLLSSCFLLTDNTSELSVEGVYKMAQESGFDGSLEEFIAAFKGDDGKDGTDGKDGKDGATWLVGVGYPSYNDGKNGDNYLDKSTFDIYNKEDGEWIFVGNIKAEGDTQQPQNQNTPTSTVTSALLSCVAVRCSSTDTISSGAGVIYRLDKEEGNAYIITNHHVVYNEDTSEVYSNISVYVYGMEYTMYSIPAEYVGGSYTYDIAVLKVTDNDVIRGANLREVVLGDSDKVVPLDVAIAVGNPKNEGISATRGYINVDSENISVTGSLGDVSIRCMRIDAAVNSGNSGGGLYNIDGLLIGIVNAKKIDASIDNMGYAIPSNLVKTVVDSIMYYCDGKSATNIKKITFGITINIDSARTEIDQERGVPIIVETINVDQIASGSLASDYLQLNDVIKSIEIDGVVYKITRLHQLPEYALNIRPSSSVKFYIVRNGVEMTVEVEINTATFLEVV